ncbi:hypothetical protein QRD90_14800 [Peribacillus frigoritolerans]|nr:hypothetical protein [Peribacillus frigoritolerans]USK78197.1 hypothetical protein LHV56_14990 [Peribacillus frigoritolerans]WJE45526.1 hypothetical protein QRD90_14800 [Peribacillus frigoritolerans]
MKIEIWSNIESSFCYIGKAYLEMANTKRDNSFISTFRQRTHGCKEESI